MTTVPLAMAHAPNAPHVLAATAVLAMSARREMIVLVVLTVSVHLVLTEMIDRVALTVNDRLARIAMTVPVVSTATVPLAPTVTSVPHVAPNARGKTADPFANLAAAATPHAIRVR